METSLYLMGAQMNGLDDNLQLIANNLANTDTPGFKRTLSGFSSVLQGMAASRPGSSDPALLAPDWPMLSNPSLDLTQGPIRTTGRSLDLAIEGPAFFAVNTPNGERLTRKGRMYLNAQGELTDNIGNRIASKSGSLKIPAEAKQITIGKDGEVQADGNPIGSLMLKDVSDPKSLVPEGWGLLRNDGPKAKDAVGSSVVQGAIEQSNVQPMNEMVAMVEVSRAYEAATRIMKREEGLGRQLVKDLS